MGLVYCVIFIQLYFKDRNNLTKSFFTGKLIRRKCNLVTVVDIPGRI